MNRTTRKNLADVSFDKKMSSHWLKILGLVMQKTGEKSIRINLADVHEMAANPRMVVVVEKANHFYVHLLTEPEFNEFMKKRKRK